MFTARYGLDAYIRTILFNRNMRSVNNNNRPYTAPACESLDDSSNTSIGRSDARRNKYCHNLQMKQCKVRKKKTPWP